MANLQTLRALVEEKNSNELARLLRDAELDAGTTKSERVESVVQGLLRGKIDFALFLRGFLANKLNIMAAMANIPELGQNKAYVMEGLVRWFLDTFEVGVTEESEQEDEFGEEWRSFAGQEYSQEFSSIVCFDQAEAVRNPRGYQQEAVDVLLRVVRKGASPKLLHVATGGGKTWIANDLIVELLRRRGGRVLWVTKDWQLLWQAARDVARRHQGYAEELRRLGGDGTLLHPMPKWRGGSGSIIYSSIQTFHQRSDKFKGDNKPTAVVWDECHWGEHGKLGRELLKWCNRKDIPVVGLTATPRKPSLSAFGEAVYSISFAELIEQKFLARPILVDPVQTGIDWTPRRTNPYSDFQLDSLKDLAINRARNRLIVQHYLKNEKKYGKAIFFACSIQHADLLAKQLCDEGIAARAVHSQLPGPENDRALAQLHRGEIKVLVNVAKLTHGVDIPDVRTIVLCRPTLSDILFSQMIGRGSRRDESSGKTSFYIVEFTDNLERFEDQLVTSKTFFEGVGDHLTSRSPFRSIGSRSPSYRGLTFDPHGAPTLVPANDPIREIRGLWFRQGQTFGIEFEITRPGKHVPYDEEWKRIAEILRQGLAASLGARVSQQVYLPGSETEKDCSLWNVEWDGSCGWEVTTRILQDRDGLAEVCQACSVLERVTRDLGLGLDVSTGTHVHLGWLGSNLRELKQAILLFRLFEPALATLVPPSRLVEFDGVRYKTSTPNRFCAPISKVFPSDILARVTSVQELMEIAAQEGNRYVTFNILPFMNYHTVEVRFHGGTLEAGKILPWLSLMMQILWSAGKARSIPETPDRIVIHPDGDILQLARTFLPVQQSPELLRWLEVRRGEIIRRWQSSPDLVGWVAFAKENRWL